MSQLHSPVVQPHRGPARRGASILRRRRLRLRRRRRRLRRRAFFASVLALPTANATLKATCPAGIGWLLLMLRAMILSWAQGPFNKSM